jgi:excisionase family DNA binding protein
MRHLLTARELADMLRIRVATVHRWQRMGSLPCLRAGRRPVLFDLAAVEQALRGRAQKMREVPHD